MKKAKPGNLPSPLSLFSFSLAPKVSFAFWLIILLAFFHRRLPRSKIPLPPMYALFLCCTLKHARTHTLSLTHSCEYACSYSFFLFLSLSRSSARRCPHTLSLLSTLSLTHTHLPSCSHTDVHKHSHITHIHTHSHAYTRTHHTLTHAYMRCAHTDTFCCHRHRKAIFLSFQIFRFSLSSIERKENQKCSNWWQKKFNIDKFLLARASPCDASVTLTRFF